MFQIWDTNIFRRIAEGELAFEKIPVGEKIAVSPIVIMELLTRSHPGNIGSKQRAVKELLDKDPLILAHPHTHLKFVLGRISNDVIEREQKELVSALKDFATDGTTNLLNPMLSSFEVYRSKLEASLERHILSMRKNLASLGASQDDLKLASSRFKVKWKILKDLLVMVFGSDECTEISLKKLEEAVIAFEPFVDVFKRFVDDEIRRTGPVDKNDVADLIQFLYLQGNAYVLTGEEKWFKRANNAGHDTRVRLI